MSGRFGSRKGTPVKATFYGAPQELCCSAPDSASKGAPVGGIFKTAAVEVLRRVQRLMPTGEICRLALVWGLLNCHGKTPEATMASALYTDIKRRDGHSMFIRPQEGMFGLREWIDEGFLPQLPEHSTPVVKRSQKAARGPKKRRRASDEASNYFTEEEEDLMSEELMASSDSDSQQRRQRQPLASGVKRGRGRPRRVPTGDALQLLGEVASSPPIPKLLRYEHPSLAQTGGGPVFQVHIANQPAGGPQQQTMMFDPPKPSTSPENLATLDLGPVRVVHPDHLSPPLHATLQSPLLPQARIPPLLPSTAAIFSPAMGLPQPACPHSPGAASSPPNCGSTDAGPSSDTSPGILTLHLPPGIPALSLPLPVPSVAPSATCSQPSSAMKPGRGGGGVKGGGGAGAGEGSSLSYTLSGALLKTCNLGWPSASKGVDEPGIMVPQPGAPGGLVGAATGGFVGAALPLPLPRVAAIECNALSRGPLQLEQHCLPLGVPPSLPLALLDAAAAKLGHVSSSLGNMVSICMQVGPAPAQAAPPLLGGDAAAAPRADLLHSCDPLPFPEALIRKIVELEGKVVEVEGKWGPLDHKTGKAYLLLHQACHEACYQPAAAVLFRGKAEAALARAEQIMRINNPSGCDDADFDCLLWQDHISGLGGP